MAAPWSLAFLPDGKFLKPMDMEFGPDGSLYLLEWGNNFSGGNNDSGLYRIDYNHGGRSPVAKATATPTNGDAPLNVQFSSAGSTDPDPGSTLSYHWTFGDGTTSTAAGPSHTYTANGNYTAQLKVTSKRSLIYHTYITASATLVGFAFGAVLGILLAAGIVHVRTLDRSLMPWIIASQTIPILAIAPMVIVILASIGVTGVFPKAIISMYLCFFPVAVALVKGLRSPGLMETELLYTYAASPSQTFWALRVPASLPFLVSGMKQGWAFAWRSLMAAEIFVTILTGFGLGHLLHYGRELNAMDQVIGTMVVIVLIGLAADRILFSPWERFLHRRWGTNVNVT
jgi:ABC-type nitrate/sulfonate/bicarbonate transport system permease component